MGIIGSIKRIMHVGGKEGSPQAIPQGQQPPAMEGSATIGSANAFMPESLGGGLSKVPESADTPKVGVGPTEGLLKYPPERQAPSAPEGQQSPTVPSSEQKG